MATKKSATTAKKPARKAPAKAVKATTTKVTTKSSVSKKADAFSFSRSPILAASVAEFIGTAVLTSAVLATQGDPIVVMFTLIAIVLGIGLASGAHVNPVITIGAWATRRIKSARAVSYLVAQVLGALMALVIANAYISAAPAPDTSQQQSIFGQSQAAPELFTLPDITDEESATKNKEWLLLAAELIGGALFGFGVASATREKNRMAVAFTVGASLFVALLVASFLTGLALSGGQQGGLAVVNPAIAGALQGITWSLWPIAIFVLASPLGGVIGFVVRDLIAQETEKAEKA